MTASGSTVIVANQNPAGTAREPARMLAMVTSPTLNQARFSAPSIFSSSVRVSTPNMPTAWSTPHQKARSRVSGMTASCCSWFHRIHLPWGNTGKRRSEYLPPGLSLQANAATVSAHVSTRLRIASSEYEVRVTCSRLKFTK